MQTEQRSKQSSKLLLTQLHSPALLSAAQLTWCSQHSRAGDSAAPLRSVWLCSRAAFLRAEGQEEGCDALACRRVCSRPRAGKGKK